MTAGASSGLKSSATMNRLMQPRHPHSVAANENVALESIATSPATADLQIWNNAVP